MSKEIIKHIKKGDHFKMITIAGQSGSGKTRMVASILHELGLVEAATGIDRWIGETTKFIIVTSQPIPFYTKTLFGFLDNDGARLNNGEIWDATRWDEDELLERIDRVLDKSIECDVLILDEFFIQSSMLAATARFYEKLYKIVAARKNGPRVIVTANSPRNANGSDTMSSMPLFLGRYSCLVFFCDKEMAKIVKNRIGNTNIELPLVNKRYVFK